MNNQRDDFFKRNQAAQISAAQMQAQNVRSIHKPLTDEQIDAEFDRECWVTVVFADGARGIALDKVTARDFARAIERAHGITE